MRLFDTDLEHGDEEVPEIPRPPRPEKRRVHVSLLLTATVLAGTVAAVYGLFPVRHNEVVTVSLEAYERAEYELNNPTGKEAKAWVVGVFGGREEVPLADAPILGVHRSRVLGRVGATLVYEIDGERVGVTLLQARDAPPRKFTRAKGSLFATSWRSSKWTCVAIGPEKTKAAWLPVVKQ